jgi:hypothetical protein
MLYFWHRSDSEEERTRCLQIMLQTLSQGLIIKPIAALEEYNMYRQNMHAIVASKTLDPIAFF